MATGLPRPYAHSKDGWELMARLTISEAEVSTGALYASAFHSQIRSVLTHYLSVAAGRFLSVFFFFSVFVFLWLVSYARKAFCITALLYLSILRSLPFTCPIFQRAIQCSGE